MNRCGYGQVRPSLFVVFCRIPGDRSGGHADDRCGRSPDDRVLRETSKLRDYVTKRSIYAAGGIPTYLIIDPFQARCVVLTEPFGTGEEADYRTERTSKFGEPVPLDALGLTLDTMEFGTLP
ncbi:Uma2 family endonuclease [Streptomyces sp. NPDC090741]|uniref:Uma2 family endonuclease n=1 Tax=Streptomyces sp. NPDC090741 TaxID=3365967 RepID=UPI0038046349